MSEIAVHVCCGSVARLTGIDHDDRSALTAELQSRGETGRRSADDCDVAVTLEVMWSVFAHGSEDTIPTRSREASCDIRNARYSWEFDISDPNDIERVVRTRLRSLRNTLGLSLGDLAARANLSASTISRVETGKRTISLDVLVPLAAALQVDLDSLLDVRSDDDVVIRPVPSSAGSRTTWLLSRPTGNTIAIKMRLEPTDRLPDQRVHPGHDWFVVIEGRVRLMLGDREMTVETGEAAEFATMTPHSFAASDGPAELIMIFDRDGHRAHVHHEAD